MSFNFIVKTIITTYFCLLLVNIIIAQDDFSDDLAVGETITVTGVVKDASTGNAIVGVMSLLRVLILVLLRMRKVIFQSRMFSW